MAKPPIEIDAKKLKTIAKMISEEAEKWEKMARDFESASLPVMSVKLSTLDELITRMAATARQVGGRIDDEIRRTKGIIKQINADAKLAAKSPTRKK